MQGRETYGNKPLGVADPLQTAVDLGKSFAPFQLETVLKGEPIATAASLVGGRAFPQTPPENFLDAANQKAQGVGFRRWADVPAATQMDLIRNDKDLSDLKAQQDAYFARFGSATDAAYAARDQSKAVVEAHALAAWGAVQSGAMTLPTFPAAVRADAGKPCLFREPYLRRGGDQSRFHSGAQRDESGLLGSPLPLHSAARHHRHRHRSEADWQQFQADRNKFWQQYPGAANFRSYITTEYETKQWKSPEMAQVAGQLYAAQNDYTQFIAIPKYRGLSADDATFVDTLRTLRDTAAKQANFTYAQQGNPNQNVTQRQAWQIALQTLQQSGAQISDHQAQLVRVAIALDDKRTHAALVNPGRLQFLEQNPDLGSWYPGVWNQAGLSSDQVAQLGLAPAPTGATPGQLVQKLAA